MMLSNIRRRSMFVEAAASVVALSLVSSSAAQSDAPGANAVTRGTLEVIVTGAETEAGRVAIALFASDEDFSTQSNPVRRAWLPIVNGESRWTVEDLPSSEYALIAYQDVNGNGQIDMRIFGMPKEPVGVSNDAQGLFGPPRFEAAKFVFTAPVTSHTFRLR